MVCMGEALHDSMARAEFQQGEMRSVFARRTADPHDDLFHPEDGEATRSASQIAPWPWTTRHRSDLRGSVGREGLLGGCNGVRE